MLMSAWTVLQHIGRHFAKSWAFPCFHKKTAAGFCGRPFSSQKERVGSGGDGDAVSDRCCRDPRPIEARGFQVPFAGTLIRRGIRRGDGEGTGIARRPVHVAGAMLHLIGRLQTRADPELAMLLRQGDKVGDGIELITID